MTDALRTKSVRSKKKALARKEGDARSYEAALRTPTSKQVDEILTIVSFDGNEIEELRRSIREAEGRLLEMTTLGADLSQQMAFPYQQDFRQSQVVSQGWQIRAGVPVENVERFLSSLKRRPQFQILHRDTAPSQWKSSPGTQNFRINLVR